MRITLAVVALDGRNMKAPHYARIGIDVVFVVAIILRSATIFTCVLPL